MKDLFTPDRLTTWLNSFLPTRVFPFGRRTPWYRRTMFGNVPWIAPVFVTPLVLFLAWKGVSRLRPKTDSKSG